MTHLDYVNGHGSAKPIAQSAVRTAVRFPMRLPLKIHTDTGEVNAITENVSANGLLFVSEYLPELNARIEFTITMPSSIMGSDKDVSVHCVGRIVRHEWDGRENKAALVIDEYFLKA